MRPLPVFLGVGVGLAGLLLFARRAAAAPGAVDGRPPAGAPESSFDLFPDVLAVIEGELYALTPESQANERQYLPAITAAELRYNLPRGLLHRQLFQESRFRTDIITGEFVSSAGAVGIAQIIPRYHPEVNPLDPIASIDYAARFMRQLYNQFGSWALALAAYNAGPGNVRKYGGVPPFDETQKYVAEITADVEVA